MKLVVHNAKVGRNPRRVVRATRRLLANTNAHTLALLEAGAYVDALREGLPEWRTQRVGDVLLLTRRADPKPDVEAVSHDLAWVGPKAGIRKVGRTHMLVNGWLLIVHRITGGPDGPNADAYAAESALIAETLVGLEVAMCVGDQNAKIAELAAWWRSIGMMPVRTTAKVGHGAARGLRVAGRRLRRYFGSDHTPEVYDIKPEFKTAIFGRPIAAADLTTLIPKE